MERVNAPNFHHFPDNRDEIHKNHFGGHMCVPVNAFTHDFNQKIDTSFFRSDNFDQILSIFCSKLLLFHHFYLMLLCKVHEAAIFTSRSGWNQLSS